MQKPKHRGCRNLVRAFLIWLSFLLWGAVTAHGLTLLQPPIAHDRSPGRQHETHPSNKQQHDPTIPQVQPAPPSLAPQTGDQGQGNANQRDNHGTNGDEPNIPNWIQAGSAVATLFVTAGLLFVGAAQLKTYRDQARIMQETREIALAALDKPYLLVTSVSHNFDQWRSGGWQGKRLFLTFTFRFYNCGKVPAVIDNVVAFAFLSSSPRGRGADPYPALGFPGPQQLHTLLGDRPSVRVFPETPLNDINPVSGKLEYAIRTGTITILSNNKSRHLSQYVSNDGTEEGREEFLQDKNIAPWLIGRARYRDISGRRYCLSFCFRGDRNGDAMEMYGPPYNEHT